MNVGEIICFTATVWSFESIITREPKVGIDPRYLVTNFSNRSELASGEEQVTLNSRARKIYEY
jgi:hypothetical protein